MLEHDLFGLLSPLVQIGFDFVSMTQKVSDDGVDIGQGDRGVFLGDSFGRRAVVERVDDSIECHARVADMDI